MRRPFPSTPRAGDPFDLDDAIAYRRWRDWRLEGYPASAQALMVEVADPARPTRAEFDALLQRIRKTNMAFYATSRSALSAKDTVRALGARFALHRLDANMGAEEDGITALCDVQGDARRRYVPYTNRPIGWHTDGYYNPPDRQVRGLVLHCACDSASGGENAVIDHEVAYILLRDENPDYIAALTHARAMTIPANDEAGAEIRAAQSGAVFSVDPVSGALHMRYTARAHNVIWRETDTTRRAVRFLDAVLNGDSPYIFRRRLLPGQGLICNNVLHRRAGFSDAPERGRRRLVYRARYYDRIAGRAPSAVWPQGAGS